MFISLGFIHTESNFIFIAMKWHWKNHLRWPIVQAKIVNNKITSIEMNFILNKSYKKHVHTKKNWYFLSNRQQKHNWLWPNRFWLPNCFWFFSFVSFTFIDPLALFSASFSSMNLAKLRQTSNLKMCERNLIRKPEFCAKANTTFS